MKKYILFILITVLLSFLFVMTTPHSGFSFNDFNDFGNPLEPSNPASPSSPLNPSNPLNKGNPASPWYAHQNADKSDTSNDSVPPKGSRHNDGRPSSSCGNSCNLTKKSGKRKKQGKIRFGHGLERVNPREHAQKTQKGGIILKKHQIKNRGSVVYEENINLEVADWLKRKGFNLDTVDDGYISIVTSDSNIAPKRWLDRILARDAWVYLGYINFDTDSNGKPILYFTFSGRKYADMVRRLADEMASEFNVKIVLNLKREEPKLKTYAPPY